LVKLQTALPELSALGYQLIAISPDRPDKALETAEKHKFSFPVVSDPGLAVSRGFGIVFQRPERRPLPVPAVFVVDQEGRVTFHFVHPDYRVRPDPELIVAAARAGAQAAEE